MESSKADFYSFAFLFFFFNETPPTALNGKSGRGGADRLFISVLPSVTPLPFWHDRGRWFAIAKREWKTVMSERAKKSILRFQHRCIESGFKPQISIASTAMRKHSKTHRAAKYSPGLFSEPTLRVAVDLQHIGLPLPKFGFIILTQQIGLKSCSCLTFSTAKVASS